MTLKYKAHNIRAFWVVERVHSLSGLEVVLIFLYHLVGSYNYSRAKNEEGFVCKHYDWPCQELFTANLCCDSNRSSV